VVGRLVFRCKVDDAMRSGQLALRYGYGQAYPRSDGKRLISGPRINLLTESGNRDPIAPYHKNVAVRLTLVNVTTAKFAAQAIRKSDEIGWNPLHLINSVSSAVASVLEPAGLDKSVGLITAAYGKDRAGWLAA
jgi:hypothetical protein